MELALESHSPFPIEQIFWGYYRAPSSQQALLYMGLKDQFSVSESAIQGAHYVYPAFLAGLSATNDRDGIQIFADSAGLSALWLEANTPVPKKVFSRSWAAFGEKIHYHKIATRCSESSVTGPENSTQIQIYP